MVVLPAESDDVAAPGIGWRRCERNARRRSNPRQRANKQLQKQRSAPTRHPALMTIRTSPRPQLRSFPASKPNAMPSLPMLPNNLRNDSSGPWPTSRTSCLLVSASKKRRIEAIVGDIDAHLNRYVVAIHEVAAMTYGAGAALIDAEVTEGTLPAGAVEELLAVDVVSPIRQRLASLDELKVDAADPHLDPVRAFYRQRKTDHLGFAASRLANLLCVAGCAMRFRPRMRRCHGSAVANDAIRNNSGRPENQTRRVRSAPNAA